MSHFQFKFYWILAFLFVLVQSCLSKDSTYDYIIVGSGPGGGPLASILARNNYSVLLIEAGDDESSDILTQVAFLAGVAQGDNNLHWDFFVRHYADENRTMKYPYLTWRLTDGSYWVGQNPPTGANLLGVYYPRGATLGGSAIVNYLVTFLPPDSTWKNIADITGDQAWTPKRMRNIFERVEHNDYLPAGTPGHGFNGFIDTINGAGDGSAYKNEESVVSVLKSMISLIGLNPGNFYTYLFGDINSADPARDQTEGFWGIPYTANQGWKRVTARDYVLSTVTATKSDGSRKYPLYLQLNTLATKVIFGQNKDANKKNPRAIGVEYLQGKSLYSADPRFDPSVKGTPGRAFARKEVIISGGTFNSPQLLKLSGIGPKEELQKLNISVVADLPGVGLHLMDNPEIPIVGLAKEDFVSSDNSSLICQFGAPGDPCVTLWQQGQGPYTKGGINTNALLRRTPFAVNSDRDMFMFSGPFVFRGFWPVTNQSFIDPPNTFGMATVKMHPQNRAGTVLLKSADPQDTPDINFNLFTDGADIDLGAIEDTIKFGRRAHLGTSGPVGPLNSTEPPCPSPPAADGSCDAATDREWVLNQAFGHHPTSTCAIGSDDDASAVLDSRFRVRGVDALRVVDASAFPGTPGAFPVIPTYMLSVLGSDFLLADSHLWD